MRALIFPGQGCQKEGMGKDLYEQFPKAKELFERANEFLGRRITDVMFYGTEQELMETKNTQPAVFVYEVALALCQDDVVPDVVAGHSLGEFAALVINGTISFEDGLNLVLNRALIGQKACDKYPTGMGAVIGLPDEYVERRIKEIWDETGEPLYFANFNGPNNTAGKPKITVIPANGTIYSSYHYKEGIDAQYAMTQKEVKNNWAGNTYPGTGNVTSLTNWKPFKGTMSKDITYIVQKSNGDVTFAFKGGIPVLSFAKSEMTSDGKTAITNTLNIQYPRTDGKTTYKSSNTAVATVDAKRLPSSSPFLPSPSQRAR